MCGYCYEAGALYYLHGGEIQMPRAMSGEQIRLYRPGITVNRDEIAEAWRNIKDDREREMTALNLWLRDGDDLLIKDIDTVALPCVEERDRLYLAPREGLDVAREVLNLWYECVLAPPLNHMQYMPGGIKGLSRPEFTWSLLVAVHLERWDDSDWCYMLRRISLDWVQIKSLAISANDQDGKPSGPSPDFGDLRLWLRREARFYLWKAGFRDEAAFHDEREDLLNFLEWLNLSGEPDVDGRIASAKARDFWLC